MFGIGKSIFPKIVFDSSLGFNLHYSTLIHKYLDKVSRYLYMIKQEFGFFMVYLLYESN